MAQPHTDHTKIQNHHDNHADSHLSHLPETTSQRQQASTAKQSLENDDHLPEHLPEKLAHQHDDALLQEPEETVLYLAYGSNLNSKTFLGRRGIKPLSQINVIVPELRLTFDMPGLPYLEPCFAATLFRDPSHKHESSAEDSPLIAHDDDDDAYNPNKPLVGVAYEVTLTDYARIIATEGGGSGYKDVVVDCHPFAEPYSPNDPIPTIPTTPSFKAHTLLSPSNSTTASRAKSPARSRPISRPELGYAQPSARYLGLIVNGAAEHDLPTSYRRYLAGLPPYRATTLRQKIGRVVFTAVWAPLFLPMLFLKQVFAGPDGRSPAWLVCYERLVLPSMWWSYDHVFFRIFGDGERSVEKVD
ncbi:hypothetical protein P168DRAFT_296495 [Aspergillus campestris IBT 28561]|uniref:gamma-glutamylcyclotransferase n=1 Tax=Aspergillus campestris (strain IBT 28561) TaxID=1392248 RepID=A0A2I1D4C3_ASPC2|nr:uncharacterized protein P168DRAFT_296495 [Aspergillus campestris IBT 28561]PKY04716.1 hypothetical protein P168DRAFT_296495 [Aspergillus campestris IBT 28561]